MKSFIRTIMPAVKFLLGLWLVFLFAEVIPPGDARLGAVVGLLGVGAWAGYTFGLYAGRTSPKEDRRDR